MLSWTGVTAQRLEAARVVLGDRSLRASGSLISAPQEVTEPFSASYALATDEIGVLRRLTVRTIRSQGEQHVTLTRSEEGIWLVDHGAGAARTDFDGALDADLAFSPLFNALPVRRLGLHRTTAEHVLSMVFVALPSLEVGLVRQTYRTVRTVTPASAEPLSATGISASGRDGPAVVSFAGGSFQADLTVDPDGLLLEYPGLARRA
jgi:uncharacterized protein